jgi:hypothetical protein
MASQALATKKNRPARILKYLLCRLRLHITEPESR